MKKILIASTTIRGESKTELKRIFSDFEIATPVHAHTMDLSNTRIFLASHVDSIGNDSEMTGFFAAQIENPDAFQGSFLSCFVESDNLRYTRDAGIRYLYLANQLGAHLPGRSLVEASRNLENLIPLRDALQAEPVAILRNQLEGVHDRLFSPHAKTERPHLSVWTIGREGISATRAIWDLIRKHLNGVDFDFLPFGNQNIRDCRGCAYEICKKMGEHTRCIYDDYVVESLYPSIERCDALLLLAPNYNDMLPANFVSAINRMTALFRKRKFYDKQLFAVIVAGHTGAELLSRQLISALHVNKTFALPPRFSLEIRAHNVASVEQNVSLPLQAKEFAEHIKQNLIK